MILPLSDFPNPGGRPYVTYALIAANILVFALVSLPLSAQAPDPGDPALAAYVSFLQDHLPPGVSIDWALRDLSAYDVFVFTHGYKPGAPRAADLFESLFLHAGFLHLLGNMLFLWIYGDNVEYKLGRLAYLCWYLGAGVMATLLFSVFAGPSMMPLVGASGAISGVLGFYFVWFPRNKVRLFVFLFPFYVSTVAVPARLVLGFFLVVDNLLPLTLGSYLGGGSSGGGVAYGAHVGGFLVGLGGAWLIERWLPSTDALDLPEIDHDPVPASTIEKAMADNDLAQAAQMYFTLPPDGAERAIGPLTSLELAQRLARFDYPDAAMTVYRRHLRDFPADPTAAAAHVGIGLLQMERLGQVAPAFQHFIAALDSKPDADTEAAARAAMARITDLQKLNVGRRVI